MVWNVHLGFCLDLWNECFPFALCHSLRWLEFWTHWKILWRFQLDVVKQTNTQKSVLGAVMGKVCHEHTQSSCNQEAEQNHLLRLSFLFAWFQALISVSYSLLTNSFAYLHFPPALNHCSHWGQGYCIKHVLDHVSTLF